jgi:hypothetical protein
MIKYLLQGWKREIDEKVAETWQSYVDARMRWYRPAVERKFWYDMSEFACFKLNDRSWDAEFKPFAFAYMREQIESKCTAFEHYCTGKEFVE